MRTLPDEHPEDFVPGLPWWRWLEEGEVLEWYPAPVCDCGAKPEIVAAVEGVPDRWYFCESCARLNEVFETRQEEMQT